MIDIVGHQTEISISKIQDNLSEKISIPTLNRDLATLIESNSLIKIGKGRATSYKVSPLYKIFAQHDISEYFDRDPDTRQAQTQFNQGIISLLEKADLFTPEENKKLISLKQEYQHNISDYPKTLYQKELERLTIELSWKSAQIEGNTYSLLETERLFVDKEEAQGKPKEDATMLLNHKDALNYLLANKGISGKISLRLLEEIHSLLINDLGVGRNIRSRTVGITGTAYKPLDNEYQIKEAMEKMCDVINSKENGFEKALIAVALISYIQPFEDGNKRTGRMISNALLIQEGICPLSYRSVNSLDYKKAMLLFYEQNNLAAFKKIFFEQIDFSVKNYFR
ncbi:MAG: Fic family protein [Proteobacteria bacterium]|nr:Fic family protein [Pseudomonadota bacterium]